MKQFLSCSYAKTNFFLKSDKKINKFLKTLTFASALANDLSNFLKLVRFEEYCRVGLIYTLH